MSTTWPRTITTDRVLLRAPAPDDADAIFARYASDPEVTKYLAWPRHASVDDTRAFLEVALAEWDKGNPFAYLAFARDDGRLLGSTGISLERPESAATGYVLARDAWGKGYATEIARTMVDVAFASPAMWRLSAICHVDHHGSERVLAKAGFTREGTLRRHTFFPNLAASSPQDVALWARVRA